jgi:uncharacterized membrane protein
MDKMYFILLGIVALAFVFNIFIVTQSSYPGSEVGVGPVIQMVIAIPLLLISALVYYFTKNQNINFWILLLPLFLELAYFAFTKDLFSMFGKDSGSFLIRSYVYAITLSTSLGIIIAWMLGVLTKK